MWNSEDYFFLYHEPTNIGRYPSEVLLLGVWALWGMEASDVCEWLGVPNTVLTKYMYGQKTLPMSTRLLCKLTLEQRMLYTQPHEDWTDMQTAVKCKDMWNLSYRNMAKWLGEPLRKMQAWLRGEPGKYRMPRDVRILLEAMVKWEAWVDG